MRFEEAYISYKRGNLTQGEAALLLCLCDRTFRCYLNRYDEGGLDALRDKRLVQVSHRRAPVDDLYLKETYMPAFNAEFMQSPAEEVCFWPWIGGQLADILCECHERVVSHDNCVSFEGLKLQIPADRHRCHYVKTRITVLRYPNRQKAIMHDPRKLATYNLSSREMKLSDIVIA